MIVGIFHHSSYNIVRQRCINNAILHFPTQSPTDEALPRIRDYRERRELVIVCGIVLKAVGNH